MTSSSTTASDQEIDKEIEPGYQNHTRHRGHDHGTHPSDVEKRNPVANEGHGTEIPSKEGNIPDEQGGLDQRQRSIPQSRNASQAASREGGDFPTAGTDIEAKAADAAVAEESDPNIVSWDGPDDPQNPMNFPSWKKSLMIGLVSATCFLTPLASSMFAPGVSYLMAEFHSSNKELASFVVSVYVLGFAFGPLILAPLSEMYGRLPLYHACNLGFVAFNIACALATNLNMLIGFRLMAGLFGSAPLTNGMLN